MKKIILIVVAVIVVLIFGYFGYKFYLIREEYGLYWTDVDPNYFNPDNIFSDTLSIIHKESNNTYFTYSDLELDDFFTASYLKTSEDDSDTLVYCEKDEDNNCIRSIMFEKYSSYVDGLSLDAFELTGETQTRTIEVDKDLKEIFKKNNINNDIDLLNYIKKEYPFNNNLLTPIKNIKTNTLFHGVVLEFSDADKITLIDGDLTGYIIYNAVDKNSLEIRLLNDKEQYSIILCDNTDAENKITDTNQVVSLLETIKFN